MKAMILCGGEGTRLREHTETRPKPMVHVGGRPILWHIMKTYAHYGITEFILCLGYKGEVIKDYFLNYEAMNSDFTVELGQKNQIHYHGSDHNEDGWKVTLVDTGEKAMTGARVFRGARHLSDSDERFCLTYGDGVSDVNIAELLNFHETHEAAATVTGVMPPSRFGEIVHENSRVVAFAEKPQSGHRIINGGFFVLNRTFLDYLSDDPGCVLEREPLERCAKDGNLQVYAHAGYWQCMDTYRDWELLEREWNSGEAPWSVWS